MLNNSSKYEELRNVNGLKIEKAQITLRGVQPGYHAGTYITFTFSINLRMFLGEFVSVNDNPSVYVYLWVGNSGFVLLFDQLTINSGGSSFDVGKLQITQKTENSITFQDTYPTTASDTAFISRVNIWGLGY